MNTNRTIGIIVATNEEIIKSTREFDLLLAQIISANIHLIPDTYSFGDDHNNGEINVETKLSFILSMIYLDSRGLAKYHSDIMLKYRARFEFLLSNNGIEYEIDEPTGDTDDYLPPNSFTQCPIVMLNKILKDIGSLQDFLCNMSLEVDNDKVDKNE